MRKPRRCSVARLDWSTRKDTGTSLLFLYCVLATCLLVALSSSDEERSRIFTFALTGCGEVLVTGQISGARAVRHDGKRSWREHTYISSVRPTYWLPAVILGVQLFVLANTVDDESAKVTYCLRATRCVPLERLPVGVVVCGRGFLPEKYTFTSSTCSLCSLV